MRWRPRSRRRQHPKAATVLPDLFAVTRAEPVAASLIVAGIGAVILGLSFLGARHPTIHPAEQRAFHVVNGWPNWLYAPLWLPMQLGNLVVGTAVGLGVAWGFGDWQMAVAVVAAAGLKLLAERLIRKRMAEYLEVRQRPGTSQRDAHLRGDDVPSHGASFPSGHVILVAAVAAVVVDDVPIGWVWVPFTLAVMVMVGRVYVGAHNPLDVTAGLGAGLVVGGLLGLFLR